MVYLKCYATTFCWCPKYTTLVGGTVSSEMSQPSIFVMQFGCYGLPWDTLRATHGAKSGEKSDSGFPQEYSTIMIYLHVLSVLYQGLE